MLWVRTALPGLTRPKGSRNKQASTKPKSKTGTENVIQRKECVRSLRF